MVSSAMDQFLARPRPANNDTQEEEEDAYTYAMQLVSFSALPMTLKAALELGLLQLISDAAGPLSSDELAARLGLLRSNPHAAPMIDRILRLLASYSILSFSNCHDVEGRIVPRYGATSVSKYFTPDKNGVSLNAMSLQGFQNVDVVVDVGGGLGSTLNMIITRHNHIKGVSFDLPHVISQAPPILGVHHIGGDMFEEIPSGDFTIGVMSAA